MAKKLYIKTYGCQMNVYDSARMADVLAPLGYGTAESPADADMVILNTCHIRERASEKVFSELGRLRQARAERKETGADMIIAVAGCVAQAEGAEILRRAPDVDIVLGPQTYHRLPEMVARAARARSAKEGNGRRGAGVLDTDFPPESKFDHLPAPTVNPGADQAVSAFLAVQEGCDKFCTFCVVPYTRGAEFSRPVAQVIQEARALVAAGAREINLLGQNVNAYHGEAPDGSEWGLGRLVRHLADSVDGLLRIRYTTSHPRDMDDDLIAAHGVPGSASRRRWRDCRSMSCIIRIGRAGWAARSARCGARSHAQPGTRRRDSHGVRPTVRHRGYSVRVDRRPRRAARPQRSEFLCGSFGMPALLARSLFAGLRRLADHQGAKLLLQKAGDDIACVDFPVGTIDIDTPIDRQMHLGAESVPS